MNRVLLKDTQEAGGESLILVNGIEIKQVSGYKVERIAGTPFATVTFTIMCESVVVEHES